jgi:hypothetical protein
VTSQIPADATEQMLAAFERLERANEVNGFDAPELVEYARVAADIAAQAAAGERERWHASLAKLHRPFGIHDECAHHEHDENAVVTNCGEFETCLPPTYLVCRHCCCDTDDCYQTEACVDSHDHGPGEPICETAALVADLIGEAL